MVTSLFQGVKHRPDGTHVNHTLVQDGWCWWYRKYAPGDVILEELETTARTSGVGLWADPHPVPSWEWRRENNVSRQTIFLDVAAVGFNLCNSPRHAELTTP